MDKAIIFFKSHSVKALSPAINIVKQEMNRIVGVNRGSEDMKLKNRIKMKTPAVTNVDEWTSAETGVGAAIAAGSHLEKGIWALFVIAAIKMQIIINLLKSFSHILLTDHWLLFKVQPIDKSNVASPIRFVRAVIIPAPRELEFW